MPYPFSWVVAVVALLWLSLPLPVLPVLVCGVVHCDLMEKGTLLHPNL